MKRKWVKSLPALSFIILALHAKAQEELQKEDALHHRVSFIISHTHIRSADEANDKKTFIAASLGLNYEYWFNKKWAAGLHSDLVMQSFHIEQKETKTIVEREFPLLISAVAIYKPMKHWSFFAGPGKEFEKHENLNVIKTGIEYGVELPKHFEISFGVDYDIRLTTESTWLIGVGISKNFF